MLLLPTGVYRAVGVLAVLATVALTAFLPARAVRAILPAQTGPLTIPPPAAGAGSWLAFAAWFALVALGVLGPPDPLENLLPLTVFTLWWVCLLLAAALFGNFWHGLNPWAAPARALFRGRALLPLPARASYWPAIATYLLFALFYLADIAPADPARLAMVAGGYWLATFTLIALFGPDWLRRGECFTVLFSLVGRLSPIDWRARALRFPGRALAGAGAAPLTLGVFSVSFLAIGSFDGLNETFLWMSWLGINPLEFPGRSAVIWQNRAGVIAAVLGLNLAFAATVWLGLALIGQTARFRQIFPQAALALLPIALAYHFAHYLTSVLVNLQYWLAALNDPLDSGAHLLGMDHTRVTTSFFNQYRTERIIWLSQAGAIVLGHMLAVILAHAIALRQFGDHRRAVISQAPVAAFMVGYTFFGLWLLASPTAL